MRSSSFLSLAISLLAIIQTEAFQTPIVPSHSSTASTPNVLGLSLSLKMSKLEEVKTDKSPAPLGPYSQAVKVGNMLYCSGQIALDPATGEFVGGGDPQAETRQLLKNLDAVLEAAGTTRDRIVRCTVFLADLGDFALVNEVYSEYFKDVAVEPSRSCVQVAALPKGAKVEIDCIAVME